MFAYIPARSGSQRIKNKNIKSLGDKPIIAHTLNNLKRISFISDIFVSTDSEEIATIAKNNGAKIISLRESSLSDSKSGFMDLLKYDVKKYIKLTNSKELLFVLATAALVTPEIYNDAFNNFKNIQPEILMSAHKTNPYWAMQFNKKNILEPIFPEYVLTNSQDLPISYIDAGLFYFINYNKMIKYNSFKTANDILPYPVKDKYSVDVDTQEDWDNLELKYYFLKKGKYN